MSLSAVLRLTSLILIVILSSSPSLRASPSRWKLSPLYSWKYAITSSSRALLKSRVIFVEARRSFTRRTESPPGFSWAAADPARATTPISAASFIRLSRILAQVLLVLPQEIEKPGELLVDGARLRHHEQAAGDGDRDLGAVLPAARIEIRLDEVDQGFRVKASLRILVLAQQPGIDSRHLVIQLELRAREILQLELQVADVVDARHGAGREPRLGRDAEDAVAVVAAEVARVEDELERRPERDVLDLDRDPVLVAVPAGLGVDVEVEAAELLEVRDHLAEPGALEIERDPARAQDLANPPGPVVLDRHQGPSHSHDRQYHQ